MKTLQVYLSKPKLVPYKDVRDYLDKFFEVNDLNVNIHVYDNESLEYRFKNIDMVFIHLNILQDFTNWLGKGVYEEMIYAHKLGIPVVVINTYDNKLYSNIQGVLNTDFKDWNKWWKILNMTSHPIADLMICLKNYAQQVIDTKKTGKKSNTKDSINDLSPKETQKVITIKESKKSFKLLLLRRL